MRLTAGAPQASRTLTASARAPLRQRFEGPFALGSAMSARRAETTCHRAPRAPHVQVPATTASDRSLSPQARGGTCTSCSAAPWAVRPRSIRTAPDVAARSVSR